MSKPVPVNVSTLPALKNGQVSILSEYFKQIQGRVLTIADALLPEGQQNQAVKDMLRQAIWGDWNEMLRCLGAEQTIQSGH